MKNALSLIGCLLSLAAAPAEAQRPNVSVPASIVNSGSTNTLGYKVTVYPSGKAYSQVGDKLTLAHLPSVLSAQFFHDLDVAAPVSALPVGSDMRSVSFGTRTFVIYRGQHSPDLSFPADAKGKVIAGDIRAITKELKLTNVFRHPAAPPPATTDKP